MFSDISQISSTGYLDVIATLNPTAPPISNMNLAVYYHGLINPEYGLNYDSLKKTLRYRFVPGRVTDDLLIKIKNMPDVISVTILGGKSPSPTIFTAEELAPTKEPLPTAQIIQILESVPISSEKVVTPMTSVATPTGSKLTSVLEAAITAPALTVPYLPISTNTWLLIGGGLFLALILFRKRR